MHFDSLYQPKELPLEGFDTPLGMILDSIDRWVNERLSTVGCEISESYYKTLFSRLGRPAKDAGNKKAQS